MKTLLENRRVEAILKSLKGRRVVVVGDAMLDVFVFGEVTRISPEAPVPVVKVTEETERLGGAANVALNVKSLGGAVSLVGVLGEDIAGARLARSARERGLDARFVSIAGRPTTVKTRIMAHQQQMVRTDREVSEAISPVVEARLLAQVSRVLKRGRPHCVGLPERRGNAIVHEGGDRAGSAPRRSGARRSEGQEHRSLQRRLPGDTEPEGGGADQRDSDPERPRCGARGAARGELAGTSGALVTRGEEGMSLGLKVGLKFLYWHVRSTAREVFDVTGAGDTAIATLALALVAGALPHEAMVLSNLAAGVAVGKLGTSSVTVAEIRAAQ